VQLKSFAEIGSTEPENDGKEMISAPETPAKSTSPQRIEKVDRRPKKAEKSEEEIRDQGIIDNIALRIARETGELPNPEAVYAAALQWKFQGMPEKMFADKVFEAMMKDPEMAVKMKEKANVSLGTDAAIARGREKKDAEARAASEKAYKLKREREETSRRTAAVIAAAKAAREDKSTPDKAQAA